jgi:D-alanine--poly(phosphoribitol) ligase subunit 2
MNEPANWLLSWFKKKGTVPGAAPERQLEINYFDAQLVDSLGLIELIADVEKHFDIRFSQSQFQDRRFSTIGGLSDIVAELMRKK